MSTPSPQRVGAKQYWPRRQKVTVWEAQWEEFLTQPNFQPLPILPGDWIVEHPSGWLEKLTLEELHDRYEIHRGGS